MTVPRSWSEEQLSELVYMRVVEGRQWPDIARRLRKSVDACKARLAVREGRRTNNGSMPGPSLNPPPYEVPDRRPNDDRKHLGSILAGHGCGFPVCGGSR